jgi:hypothetical protein
MGCHAFHATVITDYPTNGWRIEAAHPWALERETIGLCDRRNDDVSVGEVDRIGI